MTTTDAPVPTEDVVVLGGGTAGLQAAQTLGRMGLRTVVLGDGRHRNDRAAAMHNFLGHDGTDPALLRAAARRDAEAYASVRFVDVAATSVAGRLGAFTIDLADGRTVRTRRVLLATGVHDRLPDVPGVAEHFGGLVAHCPFCHGHELGGGTVGVLGPGPHVAHLAGLLAPISAELVVLPGPGPLDDATRSALTAVPAGVRVFPGRVVEVRRDHAVDDGLLLVLDDGGEERLSGLFVRTEVSQAAPFAAQLGLELTEAGAVVVDVAGRTSVPGVHAAGDLAAAPGLPMAMASVLAAAAAGQMAAVGCVQDAAAERLSSPTRPT